MRWKKKEHDPNHYKKWTKWFAWRPIKMDDGTNVWLEVIYRHRFHPEHKYDFLDLIIVGNIPYEYRYTIFDVLTNGEIPDRKYPINYGYDHDF